MTLTLYWRRGLFNNAKRFGLCLMRVFRNSKWEEGKTREFLRPAVSRGGTRVSESKPDGSPPFGILWNELGTALLDQLDERWIHIIILVRNTQNDNTLSGQLLPKLFAQFVPMALFHDQN